MTTTTAVLIGGSEKVAATSKLWWVGLVAAGAAAGVNALVYLLEQAVLGGPFVIPMQPGTPPVELPVIQVIVSSAVPALGATVLLALLGRFTKRPVSIFLAISVAFLLFSFGGPLNLPVSASIQWALNLLHVIAGLTIVGTLVGLGRTSA